MSARLVTVEERPFNAEAPMEALGEPLTAPDAFYVRNHFDAPELDGNEWRLRLGGLAGRPRTFSLAELRSLPGRELAVTLECAGNGRRAMRPRPPGTPWAFGAVSTGRFAGVPLVELLDRVDLDPSARELAFYGADEGEVEPGRTEPFARGLPLEVARDPDVLLAWEMNGEPLAPAHGHPLRLVVPGWYAVASVKWLVRIEARSRPFAGYYQSERYVYAGDPEVAEGESVTRMRPRAAIARPADGARLPPKPTDVAGTAWSGAGSIRRVEVSVDGGRSWTDASLGEPLSPHAATPWRHRWRPRRAGAYEILARATDAAGQSQPLEPRWNRFGYGNNVVQRVRVEVVGG